MNEEEKKAIERFKANANYCITSKETTQTILNLIKKQQKELNKQKRNTMKVINEKIEELFEEMEELDSYDEDDNEEKRELTDMIVLLKELKQEIFRKE